MFIGNFQGTYECPSTAETLKAIKQKHDESLRDYVKRFYNARNGIPHIQDIKIINAFRDGVSDLKTVEEIAMKKPKMVANLLAITDVCIEAFEAWARLLESRGKGPSRKRDDQEVNTAEQGDQKDRGGYRYRRNNTQIRRKGDPSDAPTTQRSGAKSISPIDMIWKSAKLFWIAKKCRLQ
jgi:hypothetical protein